MAESQLVCMDDDHVNEKIPESRPEFYYSEEQRAALEQLLRSGDGAFKTRLRDDNIRDFLSAREVRTVRKTLRGYDADGDPEAGEHDGCKGSSSADSGVHSTYWPQMSDTEVPCLDIGWTGSGGLYRGVTRVSVYTHPPKEPGPRIKEVARRLIQEAGKVVAIVMDLLTDLQILQDLLEASARRGVAVYAVLEASGVPHFLDMCTRLQIGAVHLRGLRVRMVRGAGLALSFGKLPGALSSKYMLVDGEKVMFGSYSFTWTSSRLDRNTITVMTGQIVDFFDNDFRELYAVSEQVDLYREFNITRPPVAPAVTPAIAPAVRAPKVEQNLPPPVFMSRFQIPLGASRRVDLKVPAHKYHNPKYSLVFGNSTGLTGSLQDLSTVRDPLVGGLNQRNGLQGNSREKANRVSPQGPGSPAAGQDEEGKGGSKSNLSPGANKQRSSLKHILKGRGANQSPETIEEGVVTQSPSPTWKVSETFGVEGSELEDSFEVIETGLLKSKTKKPSRLIQRSVSLQTFNTGDDDGFRSRRRKKNCIQS